MAIKKSSELFSVTAVPDGFVLKFIGEPGEREQLLYSAGFNVKNYTADVHTVKRSGVNRYGSASWCLDGWYDWGAGGNTCVGESSRAFKNALLEIIREKFGMPYDMVKLPATVDEAVTYPH